MGVRGIHNEHIHPSISQRASPGPRIGTRANASPHQQPARRILRGIGVLFGFHKVFDCNQAHQLARIINNGKLFHFVRAEQVQGVFLGHSPLSHNQRHGRHHVSDRTGHVRLKTHVTVSADAHQGAVAIHHRQARNAVSGAEGIHLADCHVGAAGNRVCHHTRFGAFHPVHMRRLILNGEVAVDHAQPAQARNSDRHLRVGDGIHRRRDKRDVEADFPGQACAQGCVTGDEV